MKDFLHSVRFKILIAILTVMAGFMIMAVYSGSSAPFASQIASFFTVPVQRFSAGISGSVSEFFDRYANASAVYDDNSRLQEEVNSLRRELVGYEKAMRENEQFREILGVMNNRQDLAMEPAAVIARDPASRFFSFTIDKGTMSGIGVLDPVITADGLVGYVTEVGTNYAKVVTVLDVTVDVGAYDSSTRDIGIISGTIELADEGLCQMQYLPRDCQVAPGDIIVTSGSGESLFPRDIVIGTVQSVGSNSHGTSTIAVVLPAASIETIKDVFVITHFEGQGQH